MAIKCPKCQFDNPDTARFCSNCATPPPSPEEIPVTETLETPIEELTTGSTFAGRYQIIEELGKGGMGKVYKVHDTEIKEKVALKLLKPEIAADKKTIERFRNELKYARKIRHENVCQMYDLGTHEGSYFITMEYVAGEDLKGFIRRSGQLTVGKSISIAKQLCEGLSNAHRLGVIHRDLKPSNIMIDKDGNARIMDFGIARSVEAPGVTATGMIIGTPDYISPEQAEGEEADQRSDIYALGVILYEMVTGSVPFEGDTALSVALKHKSQLPLDPRKLNPDVSDDLSRLILICMEKERERRYQKAEELLADLRNIEEGFPLGIKILPRRETLFVALIRKKLLIPTLVIILAIIALFIWQLFPQKEGIISESTKLSIAVLPFEDLSPEKNQEYFCDGLAEELINRLSITENLWVPARTSSFSFKGKRLGIPEIGNELNVDNILEGSLRKSGEKLRITVRLVSVVDNRPIWQEVYDRDEGEIFGLQDEISLTVIDSLKVKLLGEEKERFLKHNTENPEAYDLYLKGRHELITYTSSKEIEKAIEYFEQAIRLDPEYASAFSGLADSYILLGAMFILAPEESLPLAKKYAQRALELDSLIAEPYVSLALVNKYNEWDWKSCEGNLKRAIALNPNYPPAHSQYAVLLMNLGRCEEALKEVKHFIELDPIAFIPKYVELVVLFYCQHYDSALEIGEKLKDLYPSYPDIWAWLGQIYLKKGLQEKAIVTFKKSKEVGEASGQYRTATYLGYAYGILGQKDKAKSILEEMKEISKQHYITPVDFAYIYIGLDDFDSALDYLEILLETRSYSAPTLKIDTIFDPLRSDPRFVSLINRLGLE